MNDDQLQLPAPATEAQAQELTFEVLPPPAPLPPPPPLRRALSLQNLWTVWIGLKSTAAPATVVLYQHAAQKFCKFFNQDSTGKRPHQVHRLNPEGMVQWMQHLQKHRSAYRIPRPLSAVRINKINMIVKAFLRWMKQMHYINEDLASCIPHLFQPAPKESVIITEEEYEKIKSYCAGRPAWQPHLWLMILAYRTGMSLIDCCHLRWRDVHLNDDGPSYIDIHRIKIQRFGDKAKCQIPIVPLSDIHLWLLNLRKVTPWKRHDGITDYVHQETQGLYICTFANFRQDIKTIFRSAGIDPTKTFKCFRNSLCSNLVNSGVQLALVCKITGHNSITTLLRYIKADRRALQDGLARAQQYSSLKAGVVEGDGMQPEDSAFL